MEPMLKEGVFEYFSMAEKKENKESEKKVLHIGYSISPLLGAGAESQRHLATCYDGKKFALKLSTKSSGEREVSCLEKLAPHPNIIRVLDYIPSQFDVGYQFKIALELADASFDNVIGWWGEERVIINNAHLNSIFAQLLSAYLHIKKNDLIKHTDFCDSNILYFSQEHILKISDFGTSNLVRDYDPLALKSFSKCLFKIAGRLHHKCDAVTGKYYPRAVCKDKCFELMRQNPLTEGLVWYTQIDPDQKKLIIGMFKAEINSDCDLQAFTDSFKKKEALIPMYGTKLEVASKS